MRSSSTTSSPQELIDRAIDRLGAGIASAINLLDVEAMVIGGGLGVRFGQPPTVKRIAEAMAAAPLQRPETAPRDHAAALGDLGGALGAALLVPRGGRKTFDAGSIRRDD